MPKFVVLAVGLLIAGGATAADIPLSNADFEQPMAGKRVPGWSRTQHAGVRAYEVSTDSKDFAHGQSSISMRRTVEQEYGLIMQRVETQNVGGKPVELSALLKTAVVGKLGWVMLMTFKNHDDILEQVRAEPVTGDTEWTDIVLKKTAPLNTNVIEVGFLLLDGGTGWADHVRLRTLEDDEKEAGEKIGAGKPKPAESKPSVPAASKHAG